MQAIYRRKNLFETGGKQDSLSGKRLPFLCGDLKNFINMANTGDTHVLNSLFWLLGSSVQKTSPFETEKELLSLLANTELLCQAPKGGISNREESDEACTGYLAHPFGKQGVV